MHQVACPYRTSIFAPGDIPEYMSMLAICILINMHKFKEHTEKVKPCISVFLAHEYSVVLRLAWLVHSLCRPDSGGKFVKVDQIPGKGRR